MKPWVKQGYPDKFISNLRLGVCLTAFYTSMSGYAQNTVPAQHPVKSLPLSISGFRARLQDRKVLLSWSTEMSTNASHFTIQRSVDGIRYDDAGMIFTDPQDNAQRDFNFADNIGGLSFRVLYYRLRMVDLDARYSYSETVQVRMVREEDASQLAVYPNPATSELHVSIPAGWQNKSVIYQIFDKRGMLIRERASDHAGQTESLPLGDLPSGMYLIRTANGNQTAAQKFIKAG